MHTLTEVKCELASESEPVIKDYTQFTQGRSKVYRQYMSIDHSHNMPVSLSVSACVCAKVHLNMYGR